jgi:hypothetical protein
LIRAVGDKFAKTTNILSNALGITYDMAYSEEDYPDADVRDALRTNWTTDVIRVRREFPDSTSNEKTQHFCNIHSQRNDHNWRLIDALRGRRPVIHESIRPDNNPYDKRYYQENLENVRNKPWMPGVPEHRYIVGYI